MKQSEYGYIKTIDYGNVPIRFDEKYVGRMVDLMEMSSGDQYEIRKNLNGKLVAIKAMGE